jgi:hypothetical protein
VLATNTLAYKVTLKKFYSTGYSTKEVLKNNKGKVVGMFETKENQRIVVT